MNVVLRKKKLKDGRQSLYLDIYHNGNRNYEFLKMYLLPEETYENRLKNREVLELVERIKSKRLLEMQHLKYGFTPDFKARLNFIQYFEDLVNKRLKTGKNYQTWKITLVHLKAYAPNGLTFDQVDDKWMENFREYLEEGRSNNSAASYFNVVKHCLHQAVRDRIIVDNPATRVKSPKLEETKREFLTATELTLAAKAYCKDPELKRAFLFSCLTGLRYVDVRCLIWEDIRVDADGTATIHFTQKKTKGVEYLPVESQALKLIGERKENHESVFNLNPSSNKGSVIKDWMLNAGIQKKITFHCARHSYAVLLLEKGVGIYTVSRLLGHRDIKTTMIYANIVDSTKRKAVNSLTDIQVFWDEQKE
ncbi:site-specific integrase [Paracrocinitomix mangrovi]|uniref:site-specific integrase n=1 Tax=Paracrocinitomix mangrovi TaxID=2862509 RepID=UPI001C8DFF91|nr:site-specific integrase [Paracrocinitomix mangrovi]UKN02230.1 site-specific integrase [Paracrocinitomix mangrovi]